MSWNMTKILGKKEMDDFKVSFNDINFPVIKLDNKLIDNVKD